MNLYHTTDIDGISELNPSSEQMLEVLSCLDAPTSHDEGHPDVSLVHDTSGWALSVFPSGIVTFENLDDEDQAPRYMSDVSRKEALKMWLELSRGEIERLSGRPWQQD